MDIQDTQEDAFDQKVATILSTLSQQGARRGFLAQSGKLILSLLGVSVITLLPEDRIVPKAQASSCSNWYLCGLCGRTCDCCAGDDFHCPYGTQQYGNWSCCCSNNGVRTRVYYSDCCNGNVTCNCTSCSNGCNGCWTGSVWCNGGTYRCTGIVLGGSC